MSMTEDEAEFESLFGSRYATKTKTADRMKAERRAQLSESQRSRGGATRSENMNYRVTPAFKALSFGLAKFMSTTSGSKVSIADMMEEAVAALAKKKGFKGSE